MKRGQISGSHARRNMADGVAVGKKGKRREADGENTLIYYSEDVEDDENDNA